MQGGSLGANTSFSSKSWTPSVAIASKHGSSVIVAAIPGDLILLLTPWMFASAFSYVGTIMTSCFLSVAPTHCGFLPPGQLPMSHLGQVAILGPVFKEQQTDIVPLLKAPPTVSRQTSGTQKLPHQPPFQTMRSNGEWKVTFVKSDKFDKSLPPYMQYR